MLVHRGYSDAGWEDKLPSPLPPVPVAREPTPDPVSTRLNIRRYHSTPEIWQVRKGVWPGPWEGCVARTMGRVCGQDHGKGVWPGPWEGCVARTMGRVCGQDHGKGVWPGPGEGCVARTMGRVCGQDHVLLVHLAQSAKCF